MHRARSEPQQPGKLVLRSAVLLAGRWAGADAYAASSLNDLAQPAAFVAINGQRLRLAAVPRGDGRLLKIDVTEAQPAVRPGDSVCLLGDDHGLKDLADVSYI